MTVEEIINAGVAASFVNRPETLSLLEPELVSVVNRETNAMVLTGIQSNPWYFATTSTLAYDTVQLGWVLPTHEMVLRVEMNDGNVVSILPMNERLQTADDLPKLTYVRGILQQAALGMALTVPLDAYLTVFYIAPHAVLSNKSQSVSSTYIPERFQPQLSYQVARYLAAKDARDDDQARFATEADSYLKRYTTFLGQHLVAESKLWLPGTRVAGVSVGAG